MIVRKITDQELQAAEQIALISFELPNPGLSLEKRLDQIRNHPASLPDYYSLNKWAAFDETDRMLGSITTFPYQIRFDGHTFGMSGIGNVSTMPGERRKGVIRACFREAFREMKDQGQAFSALYPFNVDYYRQYGYELAPETVDWYIPLAGIPDYEPEGSFRLYQPGDDLTPYHEIYRDFAAGYNLAAVREDINFSILAADPLEQRTYWYLYRDENGTPKGYLRFVKETVNGERRMNCENSSLGYEFCYRDAEGLKALLYFAKTFAAYYDTLAITVPQDHPLELFLGDTKKIRREKTFSGMYRVVDVRPVLEAAAYRGDGSLSVRIHDRFAPWNEGVFTVQFRNGRAVSVEQTPEGDARMTMEIGDFTRLITGCFEGRQIRMMPKVIIHEDVPAIDQVFYRKPMWIHDYF